MPRGRLCFWPEMYGCRCEDAMLLAGEGLLEQRDGMRSKLLFAERLLAVLSKHLFLRQASADASNTLQYLIAASIGINTASHAQQFTIIFLSDRQQHRNWKLPVPMLRDSQNMLYHFFLFSCRLQIYFFSLQQTRKRQTNQNFLLMNQSFCSTRQVFCLIFDVGISMLAMRAQRQRRCECKFSHSPSIHIQYSHPTLSNQSKLFITHIQEIPLLYLFLLRINLYICI